VWPGAATFPDFGHNPAADTYWAQQLATFQNTAAWDGLWIDMNGGCSLASLLGILGWHRCPVATQGKMHMQHRWFIRECLPHAEISNFCTGEICQLPGDEGLINQRTFPQW
jgi:alpha-glucosidase (family GH31 glycosyl hydrolase)